MNRRHFIGALAGSAFLPRPAAAQKPAYTQLPELTAHGELVIERPRSGKPHTGKALAAIQPHSDDIPIFAVSTYDTDYVLIQEEFAGHVLGLLQEAGHELVS